MIKLNNYTDNLESRAMISLNPKDIRQNINHLGLGLHISGKHHFKYPLILVFRVDQQQHTDFAMTRLKI